MRKALFAFLFLISSFLHTASAEITGDNLQKIRRIEDSLVTTVDSMYFAPIPETRQHYVYVFVRQLKSALQIPNSYDYGFDSLANSINIITPDDKSFRIFNWSIAPTDATRRYYGAIQAPGADLKLYGLIDCSMEVTKGAADSVFRNGRWYGALYYRIMPTDIDGRKAYTLFGLNATSPFSNKKILEVLTMTPQGPVFGAPVFGIRSEDTRNKANRFVMEYKKSVQARLNWDAEMNAICFDHLVSEVNDPNRKYTYVPSGQYDGFRWNNGEWQLVQDLIPITILKDGDKPLGGPR